MAQPLDPEKVIIDPRKIRDYLLSTDHPRGEAKARFFRALGFSRSRPWELAGELRRMVSDPESMEVLQSRYGTKYVVDGMLRGARVRSVWIVDSPASTARLVTAYPVRRAE